MGASILVRLAIIAGALLTAFGAGWAVNGWRITSAVNADHVQALHDANQAKERAEAQRDALAASIKASDDAHASQLQKAQNETNALRDRVSAGPVRLLVAAKCPAAGVVPAASSASSVDPGDGAELDPSARSAYFALRDGIDRAEGKLSACQGQLKLRSGSVAP